jgi:hypothetical protein
MDLSTVKPEDVIKKEYLGSYTNLHQNIHFRMVHINTSIRIFDTITKYPLKHLYGSSQGIFWEMVYWNFLYSSIVLLHGLVNDEEKPDTLTIFKLKNRILSRWLKDNQEIKNTFKERSKQAVFSKEIEQIAQKIKGVRHTVIAHRLFDHNKELPLEVAGVSFAELTIVFQATEKLFKICSFGVDCGTNFYWPTMTDPNPPAEDVVDIFDMIIKNSSWLNRPEHRGHYWAEERIYRDKAELEELNLWRQKYGLPSA